MLFQSSRISANSEIIINIIIYIGFFNKKFNIIKVKLDDINLLVMYYKLLSIDSYNSNVTKRGYISIFLFNICSFNKHINLLTEYLSCITNKFNIIILTETWLTSHDNPSIYFQNIIYFS